MCRGRGICCLMETRPKGTVIIYGMGWVGGYAGGTEKSENIKEGHFDFNNLQGGGGGRHHFGKTISQILQALHTVRAK